MAELDKDFIGKYQDESKYQNPVRKGEMDEKHIVKKCEYIFSNYAKGIDHTSWMTKGKFELLRQYADGNQPKSIYQKAFYGESDEINGITFNGHGIDVGGLSSREWDRKSWLKKALSHINWEIMSPAPKIINKILSSYYGNLYDINIECIDENSIAEQDQKKWRAYVESQADVIAFMQELQSVSGIPYEPPKKRIETITELELEEANGGFKLNYAKEGEKVIKDAWNIVNDEEITEKVIKDLVSLNIGGYRVHYDREIGKEVPRYVNPEYTIIQYSDYFDFRDSSYAGEIILIPAYKLQSLGIDVKEVPAVAKRYAGLFGNPKWDNHYEEYNESQDLACGFFRVPVLDIEWIEVETLGEDVVYSTKYGTKQIRKYNKGESLSANKQYLPTSKHMVYQAKWVIDTNIVYDWGLKPNQPERNKDQSLLSFHFIRGKTEKSIMEQLMPILDDFQFTWIRYQDAKATAVKQGLAIEWSSLQGMKMGGGELTPFDLLKIYRTTGDLYYKRNQRHNAVSQANPVTPLQGDAGQVLANLVNGLDLSARLIEEVVGINPVSLGATPAIGAGKATTEMSVSSSGAAIKNIFDKVFQLKAHTSLDILQRVQLDLRNSETVRNRYKSVIGAYGVEVLVESEGLGVRFGTRLVARPRQEDLDEITQYISIGLQSGKNGIPLLTIPEALYIKRRIKSGAPLEEIELYLKFVEKQKTEEQQSYAQANAEAQSQQAQQLEQLKAQNAQLMAQIDIQKQIKIDNNKGQIDAQLENLRSSNKLQEIEKEGMSGSRVR